MRKTKTHFMNFLNEMVKESKSQEHKYINSFVVCSTKTYKSKTLNIMRDCLIMWANQQTKAIDISNKCPIKFYCREVDNIIWFYVNLTDEQTKMWNIDSLHLDIHDVGDINPLLIFDLNSYM